MKTEFPHTTENSPTLPQIAYLARALPFFCVGSGEGEDESEGCGSGSGWVARLKLYQHVLMLPSPNKSVWLVHAPATCIVHTD